MDWPPFSIFKQRALSIHLNRLSLTEDSLKAQYVGLAIQKMGERDVASDVELDYIR